MRLHLPSFLTEAKLSFVVGLLLAVFGLLALGGTAAPNKVHADCSNDIMCGGFSSPANFISKINPPSELGGIYKHYGLAPADYDNFVKSAVQGTAYKNGTIVVNGVTVGTDGFSIGRLASYQGSGYRTVPIGSHVYYGNTNDKAFASNSLPVTVLFDNTGKVQFAVLNNCGNPITVTPVPPVYSCNALEATKVDDQTYKFSTDATARRGATIDHVVYRFSDGTSTSRQSATTELTHHFTQAGSYRVTATVYVQLLGGTVVTAPGSCARSITVPQPSYQCVDLTASAVSGSLSSYRFAVKGSYDSNSTPVSADFDFGDGSHDTGVKLNGSKGTATATSAAHTYLLSTARSYTVAAVLHFQAYSKAVSTPVIQQCEVTVTIAAPYCVGLQGTIIDKAKYEAQFTATAHPVAGATLTGADFTFGDGTSQNGVQPTSSTTVVVTHDYKGSGNYDATATLHFTTANGGSQTVTAPACRALVTPQTVTPECKPGVPLGNAECTPCQYNPNLTSDSPECVPPQTSLPNTGAGDTIAIFAAVVVGGFLVYRQILYRRHRAAFVAAEYGVSPLSTPEELAGSQQPVTPQSRSLRRRRPF